MKAPDRVWENISKKLTNDRRRYGAGLSAFLLLAGLLGYLTISTTTQSTQIATPGGSPNSTEKSTTTGHGRLQGKPSLPVLSRTGGSPAVRQGVNRRPDAGASTLLAASPFDQPSPVALNEPTAFAPLPRDDDEPAANAPKPVPQTAAGMPGFLLAHDAMPWSIESVVNQYTRKPGRFRTEFHFTPTISYRKLSENKSYLRTAAFLNSSPSYAALYGSVNNMVTHKPDLGFELGVTEKYALSDRVRIRGGLQFNVNRYDIKAFNAPFALATIALNRRGSARVDSVWTLSSYSNVDASSNKSNWLQNLSFQVSAPVGIELALKGNDKMQFGIATTVQPTYVLGDRAYLITTDYKSYTQVPWLLRRWNVNTAFETFVSYHAGNTRWQVGPQVRYQLLSSFISNYPVKENLFDFGLKIGVSIIK